MSKRITNQQQVQQQNQSGANQTSSSKIFPPIENLQQFRQCLMMTLSKFGDPQTAKQGNDEVQELMTEHITNTDRMNAFLFMLSEHNEHMKINHKKELIKIYGNAAEIFEEALVPFLPKILTYLQRKLKECDQNLHQVISEVLGTLVHQVLKKMENLDEVLKEFNPILKMIFTNLQTPNKLLQIGAAQCLTKVIQNAPVIVLQSTLSFISSKLLEVLSSYTCKSHTQILESIISLILAVEGDFAPHSPSFLPHLLECLTMNDWTARKMAVDVIYTMAAILKESLSPYKQEILEVLNTARSDKIKPVREATIEAIQAVRDIPGGENDVNEESKTPKLQIQKPSLRQSQQNLHSQRDSSGNRLMKTDRQQSPQQQTSSRTTKPQMQQRKLNQSQSRPQHSVQQNRQSVTSFNKQTDINAQNEQQKQKTLTAATQKKIQARMQQQDNNFNQKPARQSEPKQSIFAQQKNNRFFQNHQENDIEILEGPQPKYQQQYEDESEEQEEVKQQEPDIQIKIYESKKPAPYQDARRLEDYIQQSSNKKAQMSSSKKVSPIRKTFLEQSDISGMGNIEEQDEYKVQQDSLLSREEEKKDKSYLSPGSTNRYQQPKQAWVKPNTVSQSTSNQSPQQPLTQSMTNQQYQPILRPIQQDFLTFNQPHENAQFNQPQFRTGAPYDYQVNQTQNYLQDPQPQPLTILSANDQQIQFLINELQKIHQNQIQMMERMNEFQSSQKQEVFTLSARIAKLEDYITVQQQSSGMIKQANTQIPPLKISPPSLKNENNQPLRMKWPSQQQQNNTKPQQGLWPAVQDKLNQNNLIEAYQLILSNDFSNEDKDLLLIKLIGKTGVCLDQLDNFTIDSLLNKIIQILSQREFIEVLLPWVASITRFITEKKDDNKVQINLNSLSNLIECLLLLLNDDSSSINQKQRIEIQEIYLSLSDSFK